MLQDLVRTEFYHQVVQKFGQSFNGKIVMDLGAGSGILSFFAAQKGASEIHAIEASDMANKMKLFIQKSRKLSVNKWLLDIGENFHVYHEKIEELTKSDKIAPKSVDTIISEPIGVFLVHERMLESFLHARDVYLKDGGSIFPSTGSIHVCPFTDSTLWFETMSKAKWWDQKDFFNVDFSPFVAVSKEESFRSAVVGPFSPQLLLSHLSCSHSIDFRTCQISDLFDILIPLNWISEFTGIIHGLAGWFDCGFAMRNPNSKVTEQNLNELILSTHPSLPATHWQQIRFLIQEPLALNSGDQICGWMRMKVNEMRSYDIESEIWVEDSPGNIRINSKRSGAWDLQEQIYYYPQAYGASSPLGSAATFCHDPTIVAEQFGLYSNRN